MVAVLKIIGIVLIFVVIFGLLVYLFAKDDDDETPTGGSGSSASTYRKIGMTAFWTMPK